MNYVTLTIILSILTFIYYVILFFKFKQEDKKIKGLKDKEKLKKSAMFEDILINSELPENFEKELKDIF